jgi:hypothetical protein
MSQIFGSQILPDDKVLQHTSVFEGTTPLEAAGSSSHRSSQIRLFVSSPAHVQSSFSGQTGSWTYVWGIPVHSDLTRSQIPAWCADTVTTEQYGRLKELLGNFVVIVDDPRRRRVTFVTDLLGVRPMFIGQSQGRMIFGSHVWPIQKAGLIRGAIDYDAVSAWLAYGFNCTNGSLFSELKRLAPGSVVVLQDGQCKTISYVEWTSGSKTKTEEQVAEDLHGIVSSTVGILLKNSSQITVALSGGYDSRYLLALSSSALKRDMPCATVSVSAEERSIAREVAAAVGVPLFTHENSGSQWDLYDDVFHFTPDGFPISKFVTDCIATRYPAWPMLNGFLGDSLMRGSKDTFLGKYETEWGNDLAHVLHRKHLMVYPELFRPDIAGRMRARALAPMEEAVRQGARIGKVFAWSDLYYRQRLYISNNFLQHLGSPEALIPFYSWSLINYKLAHNDRLFHRAIYERIFQRHFPLLSNIPHADDVAKAKRRSPRIGTCSRKWAAQLAPMLCKRNRLALLSRTHCIPRMIAGAGGLGRTEGLIHTVRRLYLLEQQARTAGLDFDWNRI